MNKQEKEHVTKFFYNNYKNFRIKNLYIMEIINLNKQLTQKKI